ncbi:MAG: cysteine hydrolase [Clostridia bacterium]|nr:cysteine hydrolase [Clostridia bacterium]
MERILIVVDIQNDFVDCSLGTKEAQEIIEPACEKIKSFDGHIFVTLDTHGENYLETAEGRKLPVEHCIKGTKGFELNERIASVLNGKDVTVVEKPSFGSLELPRLIRERFGDDIAVEMIGLCTDICVISNALILKANFPEAEISVIEGCCAGVTPEKHKAALETMKSCQINVI